jgi:cobalt/nickel transport system permease protein
MRGTKNLSLSAFPAAWLACFIPAEIAAIELFLAGTFPLQVGLIAMGVYHALIGIIEGVITVFALTMIIRVRPDLMDERVKEPRGMCT